MQRRGFLALLASAAAVRAGRVIAVWQRDPRALRCFVAGVQYQAVDVFGLESGRHVSLRKGSYRGEICYEVLSMDGARIGFVPRSMLAVVMTHGASSALLRAVQPHAVPWKQVQIEIIADRT